MSPQRRFPNEAASVGAARRYTLESISGLEPDLADAVAVMVSELAANAVRHSGTHFTVTIDRNADLIRVAVTDSGSGSPVVRTPEPVEPSGRGLQIVEALAADWGVVPNSDPPGKTVWFTVQDAPAPGSQMHVAHEGADIGDRQDLGASDGIGTPSTRRNRGAPANRARPAHRLARRRRITAFAG